MSIPYFSIIIPTYNRSNLIIDTLKSIQCQYFSNWECIIVDDQSTDDSIEKINRFINQDSRFKLIIRKREPKGPTTCRNIGLDNCRARKIIFLDSDDLFLPWTLNSRYEFIINNSDSDITIFQACNFYNEKRITLRANPNINNYLKSILSFVPTFGTPNPVWEKDFILKIGGWNEKISVWDDPELHGRAIVKNAKIIWGNDMPDCLIRNDNVDDDKLTNFKTSIENHELILESYIELYNILNNEHKEIFKKNIVNQIYFHSTYFHKNQILRICEWLRRNNFMESKEIQYYKKIALRYHIFRNIPLVRKYYYRLLNNQTSIMNRDLYFNDKTLSSFMMKFKEEVSQNERFKFLNKINLHF